MSSSSTIHKYLHKTTTIRIPTQTPSDLSDDEYYSAPSSPLPPIVPPPLRYNRRQLHKEIYRKHAILPKNYGWFKASSDSDILFKLPERKGLRFSERLNVAKDAYQHSRFRLFSRLKKRFDRELEELKKRRNTLADLVSYIDDVHYSAFEPCRLLPLGEPTPFPTIFTARNPVNYTQFRQYEPDGYASDSALTYHRPIPATRVVGGRRLHVPYAHNYPRDANSIFGKYGLEDFTTH